MEPTLGDNILIIFKSCTPLLRQFYPLLSLNNHLFAHLYLHSSIFSLQLQMCVLWTSPFESPANTKKIYLCQELSAFPSLLLPTTHAHTYTCTHTNSHTHIHFQPSKYSQSQQTVLPCGQWLQQEILVTSLSYFPSSPLVPIQLPDIITSEITLNSSPFSLALPPWFKQQTLTYLSSCFFPVHSL